MTVRETAASPDVNNNSLGLVLRANGKNILVFAIDPVGGSWELDAYPKTENYDPASKVEVYTGDTSVATNRGVGASNTLLAIVRGHIIVLYINGQYVDTFSDANDFAEATRVAASGQVGVFADASGVTAAFTNFTVYAVTSPPALNYV